MSEQSLQTLRRVLEQDIKDLEELLAMTDRHSTAMDTDRAQLEQVTVSSCDLPASHS